MAWSSLLLQTQLSGFPFCLLAILLNRGFSYTTAKQLGSLPEVALSVVAQMCG